MCRYRQARWARAPPQARFGTRAARRTHACPNCPHELALQPCAPQVVSRARLSVPACLPLSCQLKLRLLQRALLLRAESVSSLRPAWGRRQSGAASRQTAANVQQPWGLQVQNGQQGGKQRQQQLKAGRRPQGAAPAEARGDAVAPSVGEALLTRRLIPCASGRRRRSLA